MKSFSPPLAVEWKSRQSLTAPPGRDSLGKTTQQLGRSTGRRNSKGYYFLRRSEKEQLDSASCALKLLLRASASGSRPRPRPFVPLPASQPAMPCPAFRPLDLERSLRAAAPRGSRSRTHCSVRSGRLVTGGFMDLWTSGPLGCNYRFAVPGGRSSPHSWE